MKVASLNFDLGGIRLSVRGTEPYAMKWFADELGFHVAADDRDKAPDLYVLLPRGGGSGDWAAHSRRGVARWRYRVEDHGASLQIAAHGTRLAVPLVFHMLVSPAIRLLAARCGKLMLHSGTVSEQGRSIMLTGAGGAGKTTTTSLLMAAGGPERGLQADDYTFVVEGATRPFVTRSHLYGDLLRWVPEVRQQLRPDQRMRAYALQAARDWSKGALRWPVRVPQEQLWGRRSVDAEAVPSALVVLERAPIPAPELHEVERPLDVVEPLLAMNFDEASHFVALLTKSLGVARVERILAEWRDTERELISELVRTTPVWKLRMPFVADAGGTHMMVGALEKLLQR